jgi:hypothetical protein
MPWFPDFIGAAELVRVQTRAAGQADPVGRYLVALNRGDTRALEDVWPGRVIVHDPRSGEVSGHRRLREFVRRSRSLLAERQARVETVASTVAAGRAVVELLAHLLDDEGRERAWPVAVVAESPDDRSVVFRSYFRLRTIDGRSHLRPPVLGPGPTHPDDVVGRYEAALATGDVEAAVGAFGPEGYFRGPAGPDATHRGTADLRSFFRTYLAIGGIGREHCAVTDDGVRCALEYNCLRWGGRRLPPQAGIAVHERDEDGLLAAVRVYDDVEEPVESREVADA